ncbi:hypothetical protein ASPFODRAFT_46961 [Aspergillus luchuensis CBS 106.47]|uniref:Uncharacterized protein n=1 Tax=Aspergillus luchuensis (strain CBS 106.47) TaxID=1137211 RepID=A0A1M3TGI9_ASPLC|nr:hypothetical protein ASPFODRAFT_46961 [Aspergillus luchuensis CBS 106.47]
MASLQVSASIHLRYYEIVSYIRPLMLAMDNNLRCQFTPIMTYLQATVYSMSEPVAIVRHPSRRQLPPSYARHTRHAVTMLTGV